MIHASTVWLYGAYAGFFCPLKVARGCTTWLLSLIAMQAFLGMYYSISVSAIDSLAETIGIFVLTPYTSGLLGFVVGVTINSMLWLWVPIRAILAGMRRSRTAHRYLTELRVGPALGGFIAVVLNVYARDELLLNTALAVIMTLWIERRARSILMRMKFTKNAGCLYDVKSTNTQGDKGATVSMKWRSWYAAYIELAKSTPFMMDIHMKFGAFCIFILYFVLLSIEAHPKIAGGRFLIQTWMALAAVIVLAIERHRNWGFPIQRSVCRQIRQMEGVTEVTPS